MRFGISLGENYDIHGARKRVFSKRFPAGPANTIAIYRTFEVAFCEDKTEARGAGLRAQTNEHQDSGAAVP